MFFLGMMLLWVECQSCYRTYKFDNPTAKNHINNLRNIHANFKTTPAKIYRNISTSFLQKCRVRWMCQTLTRGSTDLFLQWFCATFFPRHQGKVSKLYFLPVQVAGGWICKNNRLAVSRSTVASCPRNLLFLKCRMAENFMGQDKEKLYWGRQNFSCLGGKYGVYAMQPETEMFWLSRTAEAPVLLQKLTSVCVNMGHRRKKM